MADSLVQGNYLKTVRVHFLAEFNCRIAHVEDGQIFACGGWGLCIQFLPDWLVDHVKYQEARRIESSRKLSVETFSISLLEMSNEAKGEGEAAPCACGREPE